MKNNLRPPSPVPFAPIETLTRGNWTEIIGDVIAGNKLGYMIGFVQELLIDPFISQSL
jgi:hypothetical protein